MCIVISQNPHVGSVMKRQGISNAVWYLLSPGHLPGFDEPIGGSPNEIAARLTAFAAVGADHLQLVVDPITLESIEALGETLAVLDA